MEVDFSVMTRGDGCFAPQNSQEQPENEVVRLFLRAAEPWTAEHFRGGREVGA